MPELPEVETVKNILLKQIIGETILRVEVLKSHLIHSDFKEFKNNLQNQTILDITRLGKYLFFHLTNSLVVIVHLRMEGKFYFKKDNSLSKYAHIIFDFKSGHHLIFDDSRQFGLMYLSNENEYLSLPMIKKLGPEPFSINVDDLYIKLQKSRKAIKESLLDQSIMCGIGNIYADETLFLSKIHPLTPSNSLTKDEVRMLLINARQVLTKAIEFGGSTIKSYHPGEGIDGNFQNHINVYGKKGKECPLCHATLNKIIVGGRGTTYCPKCQINHAVPRLIAITGTIGSGKSEAISFMRKEGYHTISCDDIVDSLYKNKDIIKIINSFMNVDSPVLDYHMLTTWMNKDKKNKTRIEKYIWPLVKKEILKEIKKEKKLLIIEIPLLFESGFDSFVNKIIVIDAKKEIRIERLKKTRKDKNIDLLLKLNDSDVLKANAKKVDIVIHNNDSIEEFHKLLLKALL